MSDNTQVISPREQRVLDHHSHFRSQILDPAKMSERIKGAILLDSALGATSGAQMWDSSTREGQAVRDAAGFALGEELKKISAFNTREVLQRLKSATQIADVPNQPEIGYNSYEWAYISGAGAAEWSADLQGNFPEAIVTREGRNYTTLYNAKAGYSWSDLDLARAALIPGFALPTEKAMQSARMIAKGLDDAAFIGTAGAFTLPGLLNQTTVVSNNANPGAALSTLSGDNLYAFYKTQFDIYVNSFGDADNDGWWVLLPKTENLRIDSTYVGDGKQFTVKQLLMQTYADYGLRGFDHNRHCATAGTGATQMMCIYPRDGMAAGRVIAASYIESQPDREGFTTRVKAYGRTGGVAIRQPLTMRYVYGL